MKALVSVLPIAALMALGGCSTPTATLKNDTPIRLHGYVKMPAGDFIGYPPPSTLQELEMNAGETRTFTRHSNDAREMRYWGSDVSVVLRRPDGAWHLADVEVHDHQSLQLRATLDADGNPYIEALTPTRVKTRILTREDLYEVLGE